ncbi:calcium-activated chloride channel regulator 3A-1-like [Daphnia carinata]|uniref:calcium-activated chloride channel regulator 3A-1-like n=1 Tax=Daphnia carinata TaxID=120202 RepID=UPI002868B694|nr:calcium-activated chloride channel regulator 3A-1-like [Daphnia carinata]
MSLTAIRLAFAFFVLGILLGSSAAISLDGHGYEFTVAISEDAMDIADDQRLPFLNALRATLTSTSKMLFDATDNILYLQKVNILVPSSWISILSGVTPTSKHNYLNADMRIETTKNSNDPESLIESARSYSSKMCGQPGEYIIAPPQFFLDVNGATVAKYGDKAKVILHEFAHYRYGVHDEHGIPETYIDLGAKFPYTFLNPRGEWQLTGSNDSKIEGSYQNSMGGSCTYPNTPTETGDLSCRFIPDMTATTGPSSSLMFMPFLPTVSKFSDEKNHDRAAPNKQNYWCRNRSTKTVIKKNPDFNNLSPLANTTTTTPQFNYLVRASQAIYIVLDASNHTLPDNTVFNYIKTEIAQRMIPQLAANSPRSFVGIATMGGSVVTSNGRLGGYLTEIQSPVLVSTNEPILVNKLNGLTRSAGQGLLLEKAILDVGDILTEFTHLSGSIALLVKLNDITGVQQMNVECEATHLLNSRSARLVTFEFGSNNVLSRSTLMSGGTHFPADSTNYQTVFSSVINKALELVQESRYQNRRIQLVRDQFTTLASTPFRGFYTVDFMPSVIELHFFVPVSRTGDYEIYVNNTNGMTYTLSSSEHSQLYLSWDRKYKVHTFRLTPVSNAVTATYSVHTLGTDMAGYVEAIEVLGNTVPVYIGGGGQPKNRVVEVEVYTNGNSGLLNMAAVNEETSFLVYASVRKGFTVSRALRSAVAMIHGPTGNTDNISLRDDGLYPDLLEKDGIYSGFYRPPTTPSNGDYRISVRLDGYRRTNPLAPFKYSSSRSMPIDQTEDPSFNEGGSSTSFQRWYPYVAKLQVQAANFYEEKPLRIMDFRIDYSNPVNDQVTFHWTAPQNSYGKNDSVASYRLAYSSYPSDIIDDKGTIPTSAVVIMASDIIGGTLTPVTPYEAQTVTVRMPRVGPSPPTIYFTISSRSTTGFESYAAPMVYLTGSEPPPITTTTVPSTVTTTRTSTVTSTMPTSSTSMQTTRTTTTTPTTVPRTTSATTPLPSGAQRIGVSFYFNSLFSLLLIRAFAL